MIIAHHLILSAYKFWLPNDPRGSWSEFVAAWELFHYGGATTTNERRSHAHDEHYVRKRLEAKRALKHPAVKLSGVQARAVARGFAEFAAKSQLPILACAILPEHMHLVVARHRYQAEQICNLLKGAATRRLTAEGLHPFGVAPADGGDLRSPFCRGQWKVFIDGETQLRNAIRYVEQNPLKEGKRMQQWKFVTRFD